MLLQTLNLIALLIATAWFARSPEWEPGLVALGLFIAFIAQLMKGRKLTSDPDKGLFKNFLTVLPTSSKSIEFLKNANMKGFAFETARLDDLKNFVYNWNDAEHTFHDELLDEKRRQLIDLGNRYLEEIASSTHPLDNSPGFNTVPPDWEIDQPEQFEAVTDNLHDLAQTFFSTHQNFIQMARDRFRR